MKKFIVTCLCFIAGIAIAYAQTETLTLKAAKKGEEPKEVMDAVKQDFPKAIVGNLNCLAIKLISDYQ